MHTRESAFTFTAHELSDSSLIGRLGSGFEIGAARPTYSPEEKYIYAVNGGLSPAEVRMYRRERRAKTARQGLGPEIT